MVKPVSGQFLSSLFLVPKRNGNSRPVINLKELNVFLKYDHFKMEGIHLLRDLLQPQDWLGKIDLKNAYFVIPVWKDHRKYLQFVWKGSLPEFALSSLWSSGSPKIVHKGVETGGCSSPPSRSTFDNLSGRSFIYESVQRRSRSGHSTVSARI